MITQADLFEKYRAPDQDLVAADGKFTNYFGLKTDAAMFGHAEAFSGKVISEPPIPNDRVYGGANEYLSVLTAIESRKDDSSLVAVELGAGWGPWVSLIGVVARRAGIMKTSLIALEASRQKVEAMNAHFKANGLLGQSSIDVRLIHGAAWSEDTVLHFPAEMPVADFGGSVSATEANVDYRGLVYKTEPVNAYSLSSIIGSHALVDYMHWDLQGAELDVAVWGRDLLNERVKFLFIGTHSRRIEGKLIELFYRMGWDLVSEAACAFRYDRQKPTLEGMTFSDGEQFWRNPRLT